MRRAPTAFISVPPNLLRRGLAVVAMLALIAAAGLVPSHQSSAMLHSGQAAAITDCAPGTDGGCGDALMDRACGVHGGCVSTGLVPAGASVAVAPLRAWTEPGRAKLSGWADFPANPPPIFLT